MPVRFRCQHCSQLLGIARRKIGMDVSCPTCRNRVTVPAADSPDVDRPAPRKDPLFEGSDLDALLQPGAGPAPDKAASPAPPAPAVYDVEPYYPRGAAAPAAPHAGVVLSSSQATLLSVGVLLALAAAFAAGLLIGRFLL